MTIMREDGSRINIARALEKLRPGCKWVVEGNSYDGIIWDTNNSQDIPSESEINQEIKRLETEYLTTRYQRERQKEYPPIAEQLDMIYHDIDAWKAAINSIKEKYPKPE